MMFCRTKVTRKRGFTLIEILIVISIISLILSLVLPNLLSLKGKFQRKLIQKRIAIEKKEEEFMVFICGNETCVKVLH